MEYRIIKSVKKYDPRYGDKLGALARARIAARKNRIPEGHCPDCYPRSCTCG